MQKYSPQDTFSQTNFDNAWTYQSSERRLPPWAIVLIVVGVALFLIICCFFTTLIVISALEEADKTEESARSRDAIQDTSGSFILLGEYTFYGGADSGSIGVDKGYFTVPEGLYILDVDGSFAYYVIPEVTKEHEYIYGVWTASIIEFSDISSQAQADLRHIGLDEDSAYFYASTMTFMGVNSDTFTLEESGLWGRHAFIIAYEQRDEEWVSYALASRTAVIMRQVED